MKNVSYLVLRNWCGTDSIKYESFVMGEEKQTKKGCLFYGTLKVASVLFSVNNSVRQSLRFVVVQQKGCLEPGNFLTARNP